MKCVHFDLYFEDENGSCERQRAAPFFTSMGQAPQCGWARSTVCC